MVLRCIARVKEIMAEKLQIGATVLRDVRTNYRIFNGSWTLNFNIHIPDCQSIVYLGVTLTSSVTLPLWPGEDTEWGHKFQKMSADEGHRH